MARRRARRVAAVPIFLVFQSARMHDLMYILIIAGFAVLSAWLAYHSAVQRSGLTGVLHLLSALSQRNYSRRTDELIPGQAGELARTANKLAEELEARGARAQQDNDHLLSLLAVLDHTNEIALATDNLDVVRLANPAAARVFGRGVDTLIGQRIDNIIHHPDLYALYRQAFSATKPVSAQIVIQVPGRAIACQATAATIYTGAHYRGTLLLLRDVTEIAKTLQIKTDFVNNASHELRTPLASIRAAVETLKESADDPETARRCVDIINNHALRLQLLVQDLLDLSRTEDPRAIVRSERLDLQAVCDMVTGMYAVAANDKHVQLRTDLAPDARTLVGDERLLTLTLKNLLDNAIKFTPQGSVTIRSYLSADQKLPGAEYEETTPTPHAPHAALSPEHMVLEVADTGVGIPPEDRERVFERFYTVNRSRGGADRGTGLGLAIVKHAVTAMGGQVTLTSEVGKGTCVRCIFPLGERAVPEAPAAAENSATEIVA
ncbi:MAG TPA: ATP-binding protein [Phycisphaerae bacterium]|nr:ATP-binding protein [Phycisphaerae bacterium]